MSLPPATIYAPHLGQRTRGIAQARAALRLAVEGGHPIEVYRDVDFIHLFHVLDRSPLRHAYTLLRAKVRESCWHVFVRAREPVSLLN